MTTTRRIDGKRWRGGTRCAGSRHGQSLAELALGLPLLLVLLLGTLDLGQVFFAYIDLRNAVREGASYGSHFPGDTAGIQSRVLNHSPALARGTTVAVECSGDCVALTGTGLLTVTGSRQFQPLTTSLLQRFGLGSITISCSAAARVVS